MIKNLLSLFFINGFIRMCNLKKCLMRLTFWLLLRAMFMNAWKQTAKRWKLHFWDYQKSIKKNNSIERLQRQQFSFTKTNEYLSVSKNPQVFTTGSPSSLWEPWTTLSYLANQLFIQQENYKTLYGEIFFGKFFLSM